MKATDLLERQHRDVEKLFEALEEEEGQERKTEIFEELAASLVGHDAIEREIFYPACEKVMGLNEQLGEALVEHGVIEFSLYEADQAQGKSDFEFKVTVLKEMVEGAALLGRAQRRLPRPAPRKSCARCWPVPSSRVRRRPAPPAASNARTRRAPELGQNRSKQS